MTTRKEQPGEAKFVEALAGLAELTGFKLTPWVIELYTTACAPHGLLLAVEALKKLALTSRKFPAPVDILEIVAPQVVAEIEAADDAAVVAGLIEKALVRYGSRDASKGYPLARAMIGELGWAVIGTKWAHICDATMNSELPTLKAQWRNEIKGTIARAKAMLPEAPALPGGALAEALTPGLEPKAALPPSMQAAVAAASRSIVVIDGKSRAAGERVFTDEEAPW
jgi:hypothetical protein